MQAKHRSSLFYTTFLPDGKKNPALIKLRDQEIELQITLKEAREEVERAQIDLQMFQKKADGRIQDEFSEEEIDEAYVKRDEYLGF